MVVGFLLQCLVALLNPSLLYGLIKAHTAAHEEIRRREGGFGWRVLLLARLGWDGVGCSVARMEVMDFVLMPLKLLLVFLNFLINLFKPPMVLVYSWLLSGINIKSFNSSHEATEVIT